MSRSAHFAMLGAPLKSIYWSWGGVREDGTLFLLAWRDQTRRHEGKLCARISYEELFRDKPDDLGFKERTRHVQQLKEGARGYIIIGVAIDPKAMPRKIKEFDEDHVFLIGELVEFDGGLWAELLKKIPVRDLLKIDQH